ncbi:histidine kinase [Hymenobacter sp.]|uniref:sensor histidine kinase n=1 Tax=Hymenobacter sp. TaxID=1898978 RepID=UPI00286B011F|nr:histidine kinase [Hymenobacter sp.]
MKPLRTLLASSAIPLRPGQFWLLAGLFWGAFAALSYVQSNAFWTATGYGWSTTDRLDWGLRWTLWWGSTPLILYLAHRVPLDSVRRPGPLVRNVLLHLAFQAVLAVALAALGKFVLFDLLALQTGHRWGPDPLWLVVSSRFTVSLAVYMLLVASYNVYAYARRNQALRHQNMRHALNNEQLQAQLSAAQLQALKMQLNPHFLFNTHQAIVGLILQRENDRAIEMLTELSDLLRAILVNGDAQLIPLREELRFVEKYLHIQHIRFQDRLRVELDAAPDTLDGAFPQFLLQPLVENAMLHGVEHRAAGALIRLHARREAGELVVEIHDNGPGPGPPKPRRGASAGVGLRNTRARLEKIYEGRAQFAFEQTPSGTRVTVRVPFAALPAAQPLAFPLQLEPA